MDVSGRIGELMRLSFAEIGELPASSSQDVIDAAGKKLQIVTWREQLAPDLQRVVVSQHKLHGLGFSSVCCVGGFTISVDGRIELLDPVKAEQLLL